VHGVCGLILCMHCLGAPGQGSSVAPTLCSMVGDVLALQRMFWPLSRPLSCCCVLCCLLLQICEALDELGW